MAGFVIEYDDVDESDSLTSKQGVHHRQLRPCGGRAEAESTAKNLRLNKKVSNVVVRAE